MYRLSLAHRRKLDHSETTMSPDVNIVCFRHCSDSAIFCKKIPKKCPICDDVIFEFAITPFQIPNPFTNARQKPTSLVIKPSSGTFLDVNYSPHDDLHIGIVSTNCEIFEYDERGLVINDFANWRHCISIEDLIPEPWNDYWDKILEDFADKSRWKSCCYHPVKFNCFNFVIEFGKALECRTFKYENKEDLCEDLVLPKMRESLRYIAIYNRLRDCDWFIED